MSTGPRTRARDARTQAADRQIENMRTHFPHLFRFKGNNVTMSIKHLRERLGFAYSHGEQDERNRIEIAIRGPR